MASERRTGLPPIAGILAPTTPHRVEIESESEDSGQGGDTQVPTIEVGAATSAPPKVRRKRTIASPAEKVEGRRLYLSEQVHFRLRMLAYQRGRKLSEVAEEILDRGLPKYDVSRTG